MDLIQDGERLGANLNPVAQWRERLARLGNVFFPNERPKKERNIRSWRDAARRRLREDGLSAEEIAIIEIAWVIPCDMEHLGLRSQETNPRLAPTAKAGANDISERYENIRNRLRQRETIPNRKSVTTMIKAVRKQGHIVDVVLRDASHFSSPRLAQRRGFAHRISLSVSGMASLVKSCFAALTRLAGL